MFSCKNASFFLVFLCILVLFCITNGVGKREEILDTEVTYSNNTLSAIVFADSETMSNVSTVKADIVFEKDLTVDGYLKIKAVDLSSVDDKSVSLGEIENVVDNIEEQTQEVYEIVGNSYIEDKIEESLIEVVEIKGLVFNYKSSLFYINKENIVQRFQKFAPYDDYNRTIKALSQMALGEAGGCVPTEIAATVWCVLNRFDSGYASSILEVVSAPGQYHGYNPNYGLREDIYNICEDVVARWVAEKEGKTNIGRVLPSDYKWFYGDGTHNHFRNQFRTSEKWDWSLPTPYDDLSALNSHSNKNWL